MQRVQSILQLIRLLFFPGVNVEDVPLKRNELWDLIKVGFAGVTLLSLGLAAFSIYTQQRGQERQYAWLRMKEAQDILKAWDDHTGPKKADIESYFRQRYGWRAMQPMPREDAIQIHDALAHATSDEDKTLWQLRNEIVALLNYFETISTAAQLRIADDAILKESLGTPMVNWREYLREFTDLMDADSKGPAWKPYYEVVDGWKAQEIKPVSLQTSRSNRPRHGLAPEDRR